MQGKGGKIGSANGRHRKRVDGPKGLVMDDEDEAGEGVVVHVHPKAEELTQRILNTLHKKAPFEGHDAADLLQLVAAMAPVDVKAGVDVVKEGESGDLAYWVDTGSLTVVVGGKEVDTIGTDTVQGRLTYVDPPPHDVHTHPAKQDDRRSAGQVQLPAVRPDLRHPLRAHACDGRGRGRGGRARRE